MPAASAAAASAWVPACNSASVHLLPQLTPSAVVYLTPDEAFGTPSVMMTIFLLVPVKVELLNC